MSKLTNQIVGILSCSNTFAFNNNLERTGNFLEYVINLVLLAIYIYIITSHQGSSHLQLNRFPTSR